MQARAVPGVGKRRTRTRTPSSRPRAAFRGLVTAGVALLVLVSGFAAAASFHVGLSPENLGAESSKTGFLTHWQFVGAARGTTPAPVPRVWSAAVATPTRLPRASGTALVRAGVTGHTAASWTFNETVGIGVSTEIVIEYTVNYVVGGIPHTAAGSVFVETQRRAPAGPLTFTVYWDSGTAAAVTIVSLLEVSQLCSAVGVCP
ncbi:MAG TPA: hypothetical protein VK424_07270 [Thermoplasmata archaeon]|nr:hypothetical protein [Thermoplasmata archaeon]